MLRKFYCIDRCNRPVEVAGRRRCRECWYATIENIAGKERADLWRRFRVYDDGLEALRGQDRRSRSADTATHLQD